MTPPVGELVGRATELSRLREAVARAHAGTPTAVLVTGEPGIGKTSLITAALRDADGVVLWGSGDEDESHVEYSLLDHALRGGPAEVGLRDRIELRPGLEPFEAGAALLRAVDRLNGDRPLVLVVDDAQWADPQSLMAVGFAARRLRADRVLVCVGCRADGTSALPPGLVRLADATGGRVELQGLDEAAVAQLAETAYGRPLAVRAAARLREHTGGNPLHVRALLAELPFERIGNGEELPVPHSYSTLALSRLRACSEDAQRLLATLAVLGASAPLEQAAAAAGIADALDAASELAGRDLAVIEDGAGGRTLAFAHDLVHATVLADLSPARRAELHAAAAEATSGDEQLRHELAAAQGPDPDLVGRACEVAARQGGRGSLESAARYLLEAARLADPGRARESLLTEAASHLITAGRPLGSLAEEMQSFAETPLRNLVLGRVALNAGHPREAERLFESAWQQLEGEPTGRALAGPVADMLAILAEDRGRFDEVTAWARRALDAGSETLSSALLLCFGLALTEGLASAEEAMTGILESGPTRHLALDARLGRGVIRVYSNDLELADEDLRAVVAAPEARGSMLAFVNAQSYLAEAHYRAGRWPAALDLAEAIASIVDDADQLWLAALPHGVSASILAAQGELDRAAEHAEVARVAGEQLGLSPGRIWARHAALRVAAAAGDHGRVVAIGDLITAEPWGDYPEWIHHWRATYVEALLAGDRVDDAAAVTAHLEREAARDADASIAADAARARGSLESARGAAEAADAAFDAGLALDAATSRPFERARLQLAAGAHLRRTGRRRRAAATLTAALEVLTELGAAPWVERCERELQASGLRPAKRKEPRPDRELTPQERQVAGLVASGLTNREVAAELVLSEKTIEHHLSRIYRKLGIRSRTELASSMA